ncbi:cell division protein DedD [mine drainage metagenome]|uniref:Cell division protein DedD n=1 Tax=mine drainage metagenome TaxID=410659 RepID=A0A1J5R4S8_9ZZZZ
MATNQVNEQELQFRKRARRRLVGAIALVLVMVTVLPMVLDDRGDKTPQPDIAINIPSEDGGDFTSRVVQRTPRAVPVTPPVAGTPAEQPKDVIHPLQPAAPVAVSPEVPVPVVQPQPAAAEPQTSADKSADVATARPAGAEKTAVRKDAFSVQIGVFADSPKFKQLEDKLVAKGYHLIREKLDTPKGAKIRLRVGPFATRADAEAALEQLKAADVDGMIVSNSK